MIIHVLKDGRRVSDITGKVVKIEDAEPVYQLISNISKKACKNTYDTHKANVS